MTKRILAATLAAALLMALPAGGAFARGGGGDGGGKDGGGGGNSGTHGSGRGSISYSAPQSPDDQRLFDEARRDCNGPKYSAGAVPRIDYDADTYTCFEPGTTRR